MQGLNNLDACPGILLCLSWVRRRDSRFLRAEDIPMTSRLTRSMNQWDEKMRNSSVWADNLRTGFWQQWKALEMTRYLRAEQRPPGSCAATTSTPRKVNLTWDLGGKGKGHAEGIMLELPHCPPQAHGSMRRRGVLRSRVVIAYTRNFTFNLKYTGTRSAWNMKERHVWREGGLNTAINLTNHFNQHW